MFREVSKLIINKGRSRATCRPVGLKADTDGACRVRVMQTTETDTYFCFYIFLPLSYNQRKMTAFKVVVFQFSMTIRLRPNSRIRFDYVQVRSRDDRLFIIHIEHFTYFKRRINAITYIIILYFFIH